MKKILGLMAAIVITLFMAVQSQALDLANTAAGVGVNKALNTTIGVTSFIFSPSPQVWTGGHSNSSMFAVAAVHNQAMGTGGGKAYGMAYDSTAVYWKDAQGMTSDAAPATDLIIVAGSNSAAFPIGTWHK